MNVVPKDLNLCRKVDCPDVRMGGHHHIHHGPEDMETHGGTLVGCAQPECQKWAHRLMHGDGEKVEAIEHDLAAEVAEIAGWWLNTSKADAERTVPKAVEYGSADFDLMGQFMVALLGDRLNGADTDEKMRVGREMAVLFYMIGKLGRAVGAYTQGRLPSDDTLFDTSVYAMMWRRIRETGTWVNG
jgi:hypothetical protein